MDQVRLTKPETIVLHAVAAISSYYPNLTMLIGYCLAKGVSVEVDRELPILMEYGLVVSDAGLHNDEPAYLISREGKMFIAAQIVDAKSKRTKLLWGMIGAIATILGALAAVHQLGWI
ncbi:MAG: hypothetical protein VB049_10250 [Candidatus Pelethousia sp.]|nr:hypothetical protein [Candidatus Pelethousia sp.]